MLKKVYNGIQRRYRLLTGSYAANLIFFRGEPLYEEEAVVLEPVFVLSTGRCGTNWLADVLSLSKNLMVYHEVFPILVRQSQRSYQSHQDSIIQFSEIIRAARDDFLKNALLANRIYVETNNRLTFLASAINHSYPKSKFILLHRHPKDVCRSLLRRKAYGGSKFDEFRIKMQNDNEWEKLNQIQKIGWFWNETYRVSENFLETINQNRWIRVKSEEMWQDHRIVSDIFQFIGVDPISKGRYQKIKNKKVNKEVRGITPHYGSWSLDHRNSLKEMCSLAATYHYKW